VKPPKKIKVGEPLYMKQSDKYVDPTLDWSFKKMFLTPGHEDILKTFLNDVLKDELQVHEIQSVIPVSKDEAHHKSILFDVFCTSKDGTKFIIEMQKKDEKDFLQRMDFYRSRTIAEQLKTSGRYGDIVPVIVIGVCDFPILTQILGPEAEGLFFERLALTGRLSGLLAKKIPSLFVLLDLPAYRAKGFPHVSELEDWFALFTCKFHDVDLGHLRPSLTKALDSLEFDNLPPRERALAEKALDEARIEASVMATAIEKGKEEGRQEGKEEGRQEGILEGERRGREEGEHKKALETARNFLEMGLTLEQIAKGTGLSIETIKAI